MVVHHSVVCTVGITFCAGGVSTVDISVEEVAVITFEAVVGLQTFANFSCAVDVLDVSVGTCSQRLFALEQLLISVPHGVERINLLQCVDGSIVSLDERILGNQLLAVLGKGRIVVVIEVSLLHSLDGLEEVFDFAVLHRAILATYIIRYRVRGSSDRMHVLTEGLEPLSVLELATVQFVCHFATLYLLCSNLGCLRAVAIGGVAVVERGAAAAAEFGSFVREVLHFARRPAVRHHCVASEPAREHTVLLRTLDGTCAVAVLQRKVHATAHGAAQNTTGVGSAESRHRSLVTDIADNGLTCDRSRETNDTAVAVTRNGARLVERNILNDGRLTGAGNRTDEAHTLDGWLINDEIAYDMVLSVEMTRVRNLLRTDGMEEVVVVSHVDVGRKKNVEVTVTAFEHFVREPSQFTTGGNLVEAVCVRLQPFEVCLIVADAAEAINKLVVGKDTRNLGIAV